jgi:hypothetical protein
MNQWNTECGLDINAFAREIIVASIRATTNSDRAAQGGDSSRNALAQGDSNFWPEFRFDAPRDAHPQNFSCLVQEHETSAFCSGHSDGDLEHPVEEFVGLDREVNGFNHFMQGLQEFSFSIAWRDTVAPQQPRREGCDDLKSRARARRGMPGKISVRIDDRIEVLFGEKGVDIIDQQRSDVMGDFDTERSCAFERRRDVDIVDPVDFDVWVSCQQAQ